MFKYPSAFEARLRRNANTQEWELDLRDRQGITLQHWHIPEFDNFYEDGLDVVAKPLVEAGLAYEGSAAWQLDPDGLGWSVTVPVRWASPA